MVSNFKFENPLGMYRRRWEIETLFGCLKSRGFRMEDTHITDPDKIEKLVFVLAIGFLLGVSNGRYPRSSGPDRGQDPWKKGQEFLSRGAKLDPKGDFWGCGSERI